MTTFFPRLTSAAVAVLFAVTTPDLAAQDLGAILDVAGEAAGVLADSGVQTLADQFGSGGNDISGEVNFESTASTGDIDATFGEVWVSTMMLRDSTVGGNVNVNLSADTGDISATMLGSVEVSSLRVRSSEIGGDLNVDLTASTGDLSASMLGGISIASATISNTRVGGGVNIRSNVSVGDVTASMGGFVAVGSAHF